MKVVRTKPSRLITRSFQIKKNTPFLFAKCDNFIIEGWAYFGKERKEKEDGQKADHHPPDDTHAGRDGGLGERGSAPRREEHEPIHTQDSKSLAEISPLRDSYSLMRCFIIHSISLFAERPFSAAIKRILSSRSWGMRSV